MKKILIVDDQQGIRLLLSEVFKNEGYDTILASTGTEAVQYVDNNTVDCVLLDMNTRHEWFRNLTAYQKVFCTITSCNDDRK